MVHTLWPRGAGRTEVVCEWFFEPETIARAGLRPERRGRVLGHGQPPGLARLRARRSAASARAATCPGATPTPRSPSTPSTSSWPRRTWRDDRPVRARADPRRGGRADRERRDRRRADRPHRDGRAASRPRSSTTTSPPARPCSPRRSSTPTRPPAMVRELSRGPGHAPEGDDRPVPAAARRARARLGAVGRAVAARRPPPRAAPDRREALRAHERVVPRPRSRRAGSAPSTPARSPTARSR